ncbi:MAG: SDR family NAD(P)-dependent oxidoreductase [Sphingomonas sp.]|uniref:SDR family NAD(P)-dependent oxidoreductase n=1 Tax=Sphingomonas sp. TaxID=28214 RepID=UPI0035A86657|nr:SDR family NAD(P)-dependent oxidoreductase [Sphingomonas sp.]
MRIVMTGATSGIGLEAANALIALPGASLVIGARRPESLPAALVGRVTALPLDLDNLDSVTQFASDAAALGPIDAVIGNAGIQIVSPQRSAQGFERCFAVNHLAHYLLVRRLLPHIATNGRIILTSSGTHDPDRSTGIPPPRHAKAEWLAFPDRDPAADPSPGLAGRRAYSTSKLCNLMTIRELARRSGHRPDLTMLAFDPGFVPGTGLARDYGPMIRWLFRRILPIVVRGENVSTAKASGRALAALATESGFAGGRGLYWSMTRRRPVVRTPSTLARDDAACAALWEESAPLVGLVP